MDRQLNWKDHMEAVRRKCLGGLAQLHKVKEALQMRLRKLLYQSLILPHLDYCAIIWAECSKGDADYRPSIAFLDHSYHLQLI